MKGSNPGAMPENPKQKKGFELGGNAGEPDIKKGSNLGTMSENLEQKEGIEFGHDVREPETKRRDRI